VLVRRLVPRCYDQLGWLAVLCLGRTLLHDRLSRIQGWLFQATFEKVRGTSSLFSLYFIPSPEEGGAWLKHRVFPFLGLGVIVIGSVALLPCCPAASGAPVPRR